MGHGTPSRDLLENLHSEVSGLSHWDTGEVFRQISKIWMKNFIEPTSKKFQILWNTRWSIPYDGFSYFLPFSLNFFLQSQFFQAFLKFLLCFLHFLISEEFFSFVSAALWMDRMAIIEYQLRGFFIIKYLEFPYLLNSPSRLPYFNYKMLCNWHLQ